MKKELVFIVSLLLLTGFVFAAQGESVQINSSSQTSDNQIVSNSNGSANGSTQSTQTNLQTQNQGESSQLQNQVQTQTRVQTGEYISENGKQLQIQEQSNNKIQIKSGSASAQTSMQMTQEQVQNKTKLSVKLSNGKNSEIKVMPDTASEKALERLRIKVCSEENNCQIELKEVGKDEEAKAVYEIQVQKQSKILGLFKKEMQTQAQVDAETGEVIQAKKPWWAFLASEPEQ